MARSSPPSPTLFLIILALGATAPSAAQERGPCADRDEFRELDFWVGEWEVFNLDGEKSADVTVERVLSQCALYEVWTGHDGGSDGIGLATWDALTGEWHYFWASDRGYMSAWTGGLEDGDHMRFVRTQPEPSGGQRLRHWSLIHLSDGRVRELSRASLDGGGSWETEYDLYWTKKGSGRQ